MRARQVREIRIKKRERGRAGRGPGKVVEGSGNKLLNSQRRFVLIVVNPKELVYHNLSSVMWMNADIMQIYRYLSIIGRYRQYLIDICISSEAPLILTQCR